MSTRASCFAPASDGQRFPARHRFLKFLPARHEGLALEIRERRLIRRDHPRSRPSLDGHVAHRHPAFHRKSAHGFAGILEDMPVAAGDADFSDQRENQVLGRNSFRPFAVEAHQRRLRFRLREALRRQHVLDLARADAESQSAERAVRRSMAVPAHDGQSGLRNAEFRPDNMHDALIAAVHVEESNARLFAIARQRFELPRSVRVENRQSAILRRHRVIHHRKRKVRSPDLAPRSLQSRKSLRRSAFMNQVTIDVDKRRLVGNFAYKMRIPDFFV